MLDTRLMFWLVVFYKLEHIETQNLGKDQTLPAFPVMAALLTSQFLTSKR